MFSLGCVATAKAKTGRSLWTNLTVVRNGRGKKMAKCKKCLANIVWIKTMGGKSIPCDPELIYYIQKPNARGKRIVTPNGDVIACEYTDDSDKAIGIGYVPHWATCPYSNEFRKK